MNRDEILDALPSDEEYQAAPNYRKKEILVQLIRSILDQLDAEDREPDGWEADHLTRANGLLLCDWFGAVAKLADNAMTPPDRRANPDTWVRTADTITKRALRDGLEYAAAKPVRNG